MTCKDKYTVSAWGEVRFPTIIIIHSTHVETVALFSKLRTNKHIEVDLEMDELDLTALESKAT